MVRIESFAGLRQAALCLCCLAPLATPLSANERQSLLRAGDRLPRLEGEFLTGRRAVLPDAAAGQVALVALGFTYASRVPVEAWAGWFRQAYAGRPGVTLFEVPMIGGAGRMARFFIDRGMRKNTPSELHEHVITVYGGTGPWKQRLAVSDDRQAHLVLLDATGTVRWMHAGPFDPERAAEAGRTIDELLGAK
jgi:hypothetical protein